MSTTPINIAPSPVEVQLLQGSQRQQQRSSWAKYGKCRIKKLLSSAAIFVALLLIAGAIYMHLKQKNHLGRLNIALATKENNVSEVILPFEVVTAPGVAALGSPLLSDDCLECIAATATDHKPAMCGPSPCSIYRISRPYWQDAIRLGQFIAAQDYESCVSNPECATETVRSFITSYARDCDGDGLILCRDHIMLHQLGPTGCLQRTLPAFSRNRMDVCLRQKELE
ncbi:uncharacterized protein [Drosophila virilis]|uniref:lysozyme n=1 Tax=Drosophila virilis TaxID=7244 RepID=B4LFD3_DROVI|nr:uncharacterized protein LOC6624176 [Drosophila virilis]EDW69231.1 uncharacterized protein Dvir_GJ13134, isoform A [Drosophila virilis]